jgi:hypothetical protein
MGMNSVTVSRRGGTVWVINNDLKAGLPISDWEKALELGVMLQRQARGLLPESRCFVTLQPPISILQADGDEVLEVDGRVFVQVFNAGAIELGNAIIAKAREVEAEVKAADIAYDQAILLRAGAKLGLTSDPDTQDLAAQEAAWNTDLRRYMRGGVKGRAQFGVLEVKQENVSG